MQYHTAAAYERKVVIKSTNIKYNLYSVYHIKNITATYTGCCTKFSHCVLCLFVVLKCALSLHFSVLIKQIPAVSRWL